MFKSFGVAWMIAVAATPLSARASDPKRAPATRVRLLDTDLMSPLPVALFAVASGSGGDAPPEIEATPVPAPPTPATAPAPVAQAAPRAPDDDLSAAASSGLPSWRSCFGWTALTAVVVVVLGAAYVTASLSSFRF